MNVTTEDTEHTEIWFAKLFDFERVRSFAAGLKFFRVNPCIPRFIKYIDSDYDSDTDPDYFREFQLLSVSVSQSSIVPVPRPHDCVGVSAILSDNSSLVNFWNLFVIKPRFCSRTVARLRKPQSRFGFLSLATVRLHYPLLIRSTDRLIQGIAFLLWVVKS